MGYNETPTPKGNIMKKLTPVKNFVHDHKVAIAVVATAIPLIALQRRNTKVLNEFLKEHNLFDEYYTPED